jgi:hypothetical protein
VPYTGTQLAARSVDNRRTMTNLRLVPILLWLPLSFASLACPTRTIALDGGTGGTSETDGNSDRTGAAGAIGGLGGVGGGLGGARGGLAGAAGQSVGGGLGTQGGAGGTTSCTNTTTDALNCGSCGHSCLGAACTGGICQPLLLGTVPVTDFADETVVLNGKVYVFSDSSQTGNRTNVWQVDATTPGTPTEVTTNGKVSCIMDGQLFWTTYDSPYRVFSCTLSNCAATATPIVTLTNGANFGSLLRCDPLNDELVWTSTTDGSSFTINRASPTGGNSHEITSFGFPNDGAGWGLLDSGKETDRLFYNRFDGNSGAGSLYYIATDVANAAGVLIVSMPNGQFESVLANDALVLPSEYLASANAYQVFSVPLPNGILSGAPPLFATGFVVSGGGLVDQTTFYGTINSDSAIPSDAVVKCPLSDCDTPTILSRGQAQAFAFADDATAIYWTTNAFTQTEGFSIWKAAK